MINMGGLDVTYVNAEVEYRKAQLSRHWGTGRAGLGRGAARQFRLPRFVFHQPSTTARAE
jgi:hypothetical protein